MNINKHTLALYWEQVRKYKISFFTMLICIPLGSLLIDTLLPFFFSQAIGGLTTHSSQVVIHSLSVAAGIAFAGAAMNFIGFQTMVRHEGTVQANLSDATFKKIVSKDMGFFVNEKIGALTSRYIDFVRSHVTLQDLLIIRTLGFVLSVSIGLTILAVHSLLMAGIILLLLAALVVEVKWSTKKRAPWRHERKTLRGEIHGSVADSITNNLIVKTFARENQEIEKLHIMNRRFRSLYIKDLSFMSFEGSTRVTLMAIVQIVAISVAAFFVFRGQMTVAIAIFILTYLQRLASQLFTLGEMINGYDQALLEAAPMSEMLAKTNTVIDRPDALNVAKITPTIEFKDTFYRYADTKNDVLKQINLTIAAGEKIGLIGHSGAGKTTITHLLLRFADVTHGSISIGGHDIRDLTQTCLREHIAYVPQEPLLFHRSLRDNIAYGQPAATDAEIRTAARQAHALEFIEKLPQKFETLVGERGVKLSGGQRQRIAIARAILKDAPILVLDEATSALDSESERLIQDALEKLMKHRTSIVVAHRLSTIAKLDRIIVLNNGQIAEQGSHAELLAQNGIYAKLWSHQSGGFIED